MDQIITAVPLTLSTPLLADACVRLGIGIRLAPPGIRPIIRGIPLAGPALVVSDHYRKPLTTRFRKGAHAKSYDLRLEKGRSLRPYSPGDYSNLCSLVEPLFAWPDTSSPFG